MKCPMRDDMLGEMPECTPDCAWALKTLHVEGDARTGGEIEETVRCSVAVMARAACDMAPESLLQLVPYMEIGDSE